MDRRRSRPFSWLMALLAALLLSPALGALAQETTPGASPAASPLASPGASPVAGAGTTSITRDEYLQQLMAAFPFEEPENTGGQVIWSQTSDIATLNGLLTADSPTFYLTGSIFETLVGVSPIDGQPVPVLADYWEIGADGRTYTFHLSEDATWHDGTDFTAEDVEFTFDVALDERSPNPRRSSLLELIDAYRVVDENTFELTSKEPFATFLYDVANAVLIMPKHIWEGVSPENWANDPGSTGQDPTRVVGTGPFRFGEWVQGDSVTLVPNPDYYVPAAIPVYDELIMRILPEPATEIEALKAGEIDIVEVVPAPNMEDIQNTEGVEVEIYPGFSFAYIGFNLDPEQTTLFQDPRVRQALFVALDKEAIKENIFLGYGEVALGTQPRASFAYDPSRYDEAWAYDPDRARQLLADAGWTDSNGDGIVDKDGQEMQVELLTTTGGGATQDQLLAEFQQRWREIGVEMTPRLVEWPTLLEITGTDHDFEMVFQGFSWDPSGSQGVLFRCDAYGGGFNDAKYCNPEYDRLDDLQLRELDRDARRELLIEQSQLLWEDLPILIYRFGVERPAYSERLHNFFPISNGGVYWSLPFVWIEEQ